MRYLFSDGDIAAERLKVVAEVFAPSTRAFLLEAAVGRPRLALDLGCGPGYSTRLVAEVLQCDHTVGLDNSEHFISLAQSASTGKLSFCLHDVTCVHFPTGPGDLISCRFLLTHMRDPLGVAARWATQLRPNGRLLMEEVEWIRTDNTVFASYLSIVEAMLAHESNKLYVGPLLHGLEDTDTLRRRTSQVRRSPVLNHRAAMMFFLNIQSWRHQTFIRENYASDTINRLQGDLQALTQESDSEPGIEWGLRQIAFERV